MYEYKIHGTAQPQGSKAISRTGHLYETNTKLKNWRKHLEATLKDQKNHDVIDQAVRCDIHVHFARPKTVKRPYPSVKPDIDKLARAILDSLTKAQIIRDDSRVVDLRITKHYTTYASRITINLWRLNDER